MSKQPHIIFDRIMSIFEMYNLGVLWPSKVEGIKSCFEVFVEELIGGTLKETLSIKDVEWQRGGWVSGAEYQVFRVFTFHAEHSSSFCMLFSLREWMASVLRWIRLFRDFGELIANNLEAPTLLFWFTGILIVLIFLINPCQRLLSKSWHSSQPLSHAQNKQTPCQFFF